MDFDEAERRAWPFVREELIKTFPDPTPDDPDRLHIGVGEDQGFFHRITKYEVRHLSAKKAYWSDTLEEVILFPEVDVGGGVSGCGLLVTEVKVEIVELLDIMPCLECFPDDGEM